MSRRVVITSIGVVSSLGFTSGQIIDNLKKGGVTFKRPDFDEEVVVCPVRDFDVKSFTGRFKNARYLNRGAQFCVAAALAAVKEAMLDEGLRAKTGLFIGTGPNLDIGGEFPEIRAGQMDRKALAALWILRFLPNTAASVIAELTGIHGENFTINTACSASLQAIGEAFRKIKDGYLDTALAGGGDSRLSYGGVLAYKKAQALFTGAGDPKEASRPFDTNRKGFVPGEGGAFFLLEEMEHALQRGGKIHAEICGFGASIDGHSMTAPDPEGKWGETAIIEALQEAGTSPRRIDVVSAHGTGTSLNDSVEASMIDRIYGEHRPFIIALKSWVGHVAAACGAVELAICLGCMQHGYLPKIRNLIEPDHQKINFVREDIADSPRTIMLENFGFGGQNSALVIRSWEK